MQFTILTLFPEMFESVFSSGVIGRAADSGLLSINTHNIRDYTTDKHRVVDDRPYSGGSGMVMKPEPIAAAIKDVRGADNDSKVILLSPGGRTFNNAIAKELSGFEKLIFICGRYEGIDERIKEKYVDLELSIGDFVLSGGEYAAMAIIDSVARYIPGVLGNEDSVVDESFSTGLLEYPQYTRPEEFEGSSVPEILLSGDHKKIEQWKRQKSIEKTFAGRPDLIDRNILELDDINTVDNLKRKLEKNSNLYIALVHYPVYNKRLDVVKTSFTNIDVLDMARAARTYGIKGFYLVHPVEEQRDLIRTVMEHWTKGKGYEYNTSRKESLEYTYISESLSDTIETIEKLEGSKPKIIVTDARYSDKMTGYLEMRETIESDSNPFLLLFGTGYGLIREIIESADYNLKPVVGSETFNHLSVRSAASIILDRLCSVKI
ncbi:MAG: tRNA (guanosine(37)-N1)-methyltransferase TrmD [Candidatus Dadabacteria bacterium]|nr:tRNA (guanosine(37)-N1)-methyltransferase TrmD [Candidatus Dadabacteria bacterium]NIV41184.1 tRNA (guanosine(37)-N1)-methyltransferase TrmD [Candidatus Dadabacteria bacterium]NIX14473.1 tRNA (guanosine(37)-N1)-methyltransferase TrmD [Candidatus Dadabacteria bacterium]